MGLKIDKLDNQYNYPILANIKGEKHRVLIIDKDHNGVEINTNDGTIKHYGKIKEIFNSGLDLYEVWPIGSSISFMQEYTPF
jgi:hypothetical protein